VLADSPAKAGASGAGHGTLSDLQHSKSELIYTISRVVRQCCDKKFCPVTPLDPPLQPTIISPFPATAHF
jgi:hypothetical protein